MSLWQFQTHNSGEVKNIFVFIDQDQDCTLHKTAFRSKADHPWMCIQLRWVTLTLTLLPRRRWLCE